MPERGPSRRWLYCGLLLLACLVSSPVCALALTLEIGNLRYAALEIDAARLSLPGDGTAHLTLGRLKFGAIEYRDLVVYCAGFRLERDVLACPRGEVRRGRSPRPGAEGGEGGTNADARPPLPFSLLWRPRAHSIEFSIHDVDVVAFSSLIHRLRAYAPTGRADLQLAITRERLRAALKLRDLSFANQAGSLAGEGIALDVSIAAARGTDGSWHGQAKIDWPQGELYIAPWYRRAGLTASASGRLIGTELDIDSAHIEVAGVGAVFAGLTFDRDGRLRRWGVVSEALDLAAAMREWGQPWLDVRDGLKLSVAGEVRFAAEGDADGLRHAYLGLRKAQLADAAGRFAFADLHLVLPWARALTTEAELAVGEGRLGVLPLGAFRLPFDVAGRGLRLRGLRVPLLDGALYIDEMRAERAETGWQGRFSGGLEAVSMPQLSQALELPWMDGRVSARLTDVRWQGREMTFAGGLDIEVFAGRIAVQHLQLIDLMLPTQRLLADVKARELDFGMLTGTFDFGAIEGRFDIDIEGLELQGGRPLAFRAAVRNSAGEYRRTLSRSALRDISALGGLAASAAVQASPVRLFDRFDYQRLGFTARLHGEVLTVDGLEAVGDGFLLIDGAGLPRVQVIGYNRRIDWPTLIARLQAVVAGKTRPVFD